MEEAGVTEDEIVARYRALIRTTPANLLQLCDMHNIPLATNLATAELLIKALERGDLEWRNI